MCLAIVKGTFSKLKNHLRLFHGFLKTMGVAVELYIVEIMIANPNSTVLINIEIMFYIVPLKKFTQHLFVSLVIRFFSAVLMLRGT